MGSFWKKWGFLIFTQATAETTELKGERWFLYGMITHARNFIYHWITVIIRSKQMHGIKEEMLAQARVCGLFFCSQHRNKRKQCPVAPFHWKQTVLPPLSLSEPFQAAGAVQGTVAVLSLPIRLGTQQFISLPVGRALWIQGSLSGLLSTLSSETRCPHKF